MSTIRISRKAAVAILADYDSSIRLVEWRTSGAYQELRAALAPKPRREKKLPGPTIKQAKAKKRRATQNETREIYDAVAKRAGVKCEACDELFSPADPPEMDHFLPRGRFPQSVRTCWLIHRSCHRMKHAGDPSALVWWRAFCWHARRLGLVAEEQLARNKVASLETQGRGVAP